MTPDELAVLINEPERRAEVSAHDLVISLLARIDMHQPIRAFISTTPDIAIQDADRADVARSAGYPLPLDGIPIAVKDNIDVALVRTTCGSKFFENNVATRDAEVVSRLRAAGAVVVGKTNLHEFAFGGTTDNPFYGTCRNPWHPARIPGGSSGGSGAAVAADLCFAAIGSDTGGSIRVPAALTGVAGLRPTYGTVSNRGVFPVACALDTVGPMARSVFDLARFLDVMVGGARNPANREFAKPLAPLKRNLRGVKIGVPDRYFFEDLEPEVDRLVKAAIGVLADLGGKVMPIHLSDAALANEYCTQLIRAEALALHGDRYRRQPSMFGADVRRNLQLAEEIQTPADISRMREWSRRWKVVVNKVLNTVDIAVVPTCPIVAPPIIGVDTISTSARVGQMTQPWSLAEVPAISVPCGFTTEGLPVGLQLVAARRNERKILNTGILYQRVTNWHLRRPPSISHVDW